MKSDTQDVGEGWTHLTLTFSLTLTLTLLTLLSHTLTRTIHANPKPNPNADTRLDPHPNPGTAQVGGFHAVKSGEEAVGEGWTHLTDWRASGGKGLYSSGGGFYDKAGVLP